MSNIVKCKDKLYQVVEAGPWQAVAEIKVTEVTNLCNRWDGFLIPLELMHQAQSFCEWSYEETKSEAMVNFFYHAEHGWKFVVLPQKGHTGMAVEIIQDHPNLPALHQEHLAGGGWDPAGSLHHHCKSTAFQSHTDQNDERTKTGLHITLGGISEKEYSIDIRSVYPVGNFTPVILTDWFEAPEKIEMNGVTIKLSAAQQNDLLRSFLTTPPKERAFPEWWKGNLIKVERPPVVHGDSHWNGNVTQQYAQGVVSQYGNRHWVCEYDKTKFAKALVQLRQFWGDCDLQTIYASIQELTWANDLVEAMVDCDMYCEDAMEFIEKEIDKERERLGASAIEGNKDENAYNLSDDEIRELNAWQ